MGKAATASALIVALAKKKAAGKLRPDEDYRTCARGILAAIKSGNEDHMVTALRALHEVSRGDAETGDE